MPPTGHLEECVKHGFVSFPIYALQLINSSSPNHDIEGLQNMAHSEFDLVPVARPVNADPPTQADDGVRGGRHPHIHHPVADSTSNFSSMAFRLLTVRLSAPCARIWNRPSQNHMKATMIFSPHSVKLCGPVLSIRSFGVFPKTKAFFQWFNKPWLRRVFRAVRMSSLLMMIWGSCYTYGKMVLLDDPFGHQQAARHKVLSSLGAKFCFQFVENENISLQVGKVLSENPNNVGNAMHVKSVNVSHILIRFQVPIILFALRTKT